MSVPLLAVFIAAVIVSLGVLIFAKVFRNQPGVRPRAANLIWIALYALAIVGLRSLFKKFHVDLFKPDSLPGAAFWLLLSGAAWVELLARIWQRRHAGQTLLDLGPTSSRRIAYALAGISVLAAILITIAQESRRFWQIQIVLQVAVASNLLFWASGRLQVRAGGFLTPFGLLRWEKIRAHSWTEAGSLRLTTSNSLPWVRSVEINVPREQASALEHLLSVHAR